jgi:hypothetical protein
MASTAERIERLKKMRGSVDNLISSFSERVTDAPLAKCARPATCLRAAQNLRAIIDRMIEPAVKARSEMFREIQTPGYVSPEAYRVGW